MPESLRASSTSRRIPMTNPQPCSPISRGDSMPYVVIEAAAAGIPMIAANVGGIPEIFGPHQGALFAPNSAGAMADAIETALDDPAATGERAKTLRERIFMHFSQKAMVEGVLASYGEAFARR